jgi:uncharacterized protein YbjT (DUF2867 family)
MEQYVLQAFGSSSDAIWGVRKFKKMKRLLLFGATGNLGKEIAKEVVHRGYDLTVVVRNNQKAEQLANITNKYIVADITDAKSLTDICNDFEIVVSALGKSVSPNDNSKPTFNDIDFIANSNILDEAIKSKVKKFVYISAFHSEKYLHLEYFRVHHEFSERLRKSGINYSIIKPPALFCGFLDLMLMAKKGQLINIGKGENLTNPIYEGDLAKICVDAINQPNVIIEAGGKEILSRRQINETIQNIVAPNKKIRTIPLGLFKFGLPLIKLFNRNSFDKFSFFVEVIQHDTIAPQIGEMNLEKYVKKVVSK